MFVSFTGITAGKQIFQKEVLTARVSKPGKDAIEFCLLPSAFKSCPQTIAAFSFASQKSHNLFTASRSQYSIGIQQKGVFAFHYCQCLIISRAKTFILFIDYSDDGRKFLLQHRHRTIGRRIINNNNFKDKISGQFDILNSDSLSKDLLCSS